MPINWMVQDMTGTRPQVELGGVRLKYKVGVEYQDRDKLDALKAEAKQYAASREPQRHGSDVEKDLARRMYALGAPFSEIADALGRAHRTVSLWINRK